MSTEISWTDETWNPTVGCSRVSPGCENCYAEKVAHRGMSPQHKGLTVLGKQGVRWNGEINLVPSALEKPLRWRKPRKVFVDSMSDLFHPGVPFEYIAAVFAVMAACPQHTFQVLTKRPERMLEFFAWLRKQHRNPEHYPDDVGNILQMHVGPHWPELPEDEGDGIETGRFAGLTYIGEDFSDMGNPPTWPLPNVWLGVSVEDQQRADERIPLLLECPAAVRFLSCEPLLEPVAIGLAGTLPRELTGGAYVPVSAWLHWVIVGGESGPGARPCALEWLDAIVDECKAAAVPVFVKQLGACVVSEVRSADTVEEARDLCGPDKNDRWLWYAGLADRKGGNIHEFPHHLMVRQFPEVPHA